MNIISWNINGIRANYNKGAFTALFDGSLLKTKNKKLIKRMSIFSKINKTVKWLKKIVLDNIIKIIYLNG